VNIIRDIHVRNVAAGLVTGFFAAAALPIMVLKTAENGGYTANEAIWWITLIYVMGGLLSIGLAIRYRVPLAGLSSLTGVVYLATVSHQFTFHQLLGACFVAGLLMLVLGLSGVFNKLLSLVPREILASMLAGMIVQFLIRFVVSLQEAAIAGGAALAAFLLFQHSRRFPPILASIAAGFVVLLLTQPIETVSHLPFSLPPFIVPEFHFVTFLSVTIPFTLLILSNDVAVGLSALEQNGYRPPTNAAIALGGVLTMAMSFFGGTNANAAGMMTAICAGEEAGAKEKRYVAAIVTSVFCILFGIFSYRLIPFIQALPAPFVSVLVGLTLIGVFANSLHVGFANPAMKLSSAMTFIIAASNIQIAHISAPVWAVLAGAVIAKWIEGRGRETPAGGKQTSKENSSAEQTGGKQSSVDAGD
jgi:benzoate membrane transport protein